MLISWCLLKPDTWGTPASERSPLAAARNVGPSCAGAVGLSCFGLRVCSPAAISIGSLPHTGTFLHGVFLSDSAQPGKDPRFLLCSSAGRGVSFRYLFIFALLSANAAVLQRRAAERGSGDILK